MKRLRNTEYKTQLSYSSKPSRKSNSVIKIRRKQSNNDEQYTNLRSVSVPLEEESRAREKKTYRTVKIRRKTHKKLNNLAFQDMHLKESLKKQQQAIFISKNNPVHSRRNDHFFNNLYHKTDKNSTQSQYKSYNSTQTQLSKNKKTHPKSKKIKIQQQQKSYFDQYRPKSLKEILHSSQIFSSSNMKISSLVDFESIKFRSTKQIKKRRKLRTLKKIICVSKTQPSTTKSPANQKVYGISMNPDDCSRSNLTSVDKMVKSKLNKNNFSFFSGLQTSNSIRKRKKYRSKTINSLEESSPLFPEEQTYEDCIVKSRKKRSRKKPQLSLKSLDNSPFSPDGEFNPSTFSNPGPKNQSLFIPLQITPKVRHSDKNIRKRKFSSFESLTSNKSESSESSVKQPLEKVLEKEEGDSSPIRNLFSPIIRKMLILKTKTPKNFHLKKNDVGFQQMSIRDRFEIYDLLKQNTSLDYLDQFSKTPFIVVNSLKEGLPSTLELIRKKAIIHSLLEQSKTRRFHLRILSTRFHLISLSTFHKLEFEVYSVISCPSDTNKLEEEKILKIITKNNKSVSMNFLDFQKLVWSDCWLFLLTITPSEEFKEILDEEEIREQVENTGRDNIQDVSQAMDSIFRREVIPDYHHLRFIISKEWPPSQVYKVIHSFITQNIVKKVNEFSTQNMSHETVKFFGFGDKEVTESSLLEGLKDSVICIENINFLKRIKEMIHRIKMKSSRDYDPEHEYITIEKPDGTETLTLKFLKQRRHIQNPLEDKPINLQDLESEAKEIEVLEFSTLVSSKTRFLD